MKQWIKVFLAIFFIFSLNSMKAIANSDIDLSVESGINGIAKEEQGFPVKITVTNNGESFSGELVVTVSPNPQSAGNLVFPVEIAANTEKTIEFSVPGDRMDAYYSHNNNSDFQQVRLYEGNWDSGNLVATEKYFKPRWVQRDQLTIGVLSEQPDSLNTLKLIDFGTNSDVLFLEKSDIPNHTTGLELLNVLVIHDFSVADLNKEQQRAIVEWMYKGGHLIAGSEPMLNEKLGLLGKHVPMNVKDSVSLGELSVYENAFHQQLMLESPLNIYTGELSEQADVLFEEDGIPIVTQKNVGLGGSFTLTSYSLSNPMIVSWEGHDLFWKQIISNLSNNNRFNMKYRSYYGDQLTYAVGENSSRFPSFSGEKLPIIYLIIGVYILILVPVQYFILKRKDKREWAWIIIPVASIAFSIGIFSFGASERLGLTINESSVMALDGQGQGTGYAGFSLLSNGSGDYTASVLKNESGIQGIRPFPVATGYMNNQDDLQDYAFITKQANKETVHFKNVEFWSIRSSKLDLPLQEVGKIDGSLLYKDGVVRGTLTNQLPFSLSEIYLLAGTEYFELGKLNKGESLDVSLEVGVNINQFLNQPGNNIPAVMFPNAAGYNSRLQELSVEDRKKYQLIEQIVRQNFYTGTNDGPILLAISNESLIPIMIDEKKPKVNSLHIITQPIPMNIQADAISIKRDTLIPEIAVINGNLHFNGLQEEEHFVDVSPGTFDLTYRLPSIFRQEGAKVKGVEITFVHQRNNTTFKVYNHQTSQYEQIKGNNRVYAINEELDKYINQNGNFIIQFDQSVNGRVDIPKVSIEGMLNND